MRGILSTLMPKQSSRTACNPTTQTARTRGRIVGLVLHAAAQAGVAPYSLVSWQADANIGIGLGILGFLVLGFPWSLSYFLIDFTSDTGEYAALSYTALVASAAVNLVIHGRMVRRARTDG